MTTLTNLNTAWLPHVQQRVEQQLMRYLPAVDGEPNALYRAMHYAVLNGGKRLRPALVYATGQDLNASLSRLDLAATAVELIHCYSLVHDDLPAMDDDDLRRGKPSCHIAFDEATAILAGDALQSLAFECLSRQTTEQHQPTLIIKMIQTLTHLSGGEGMGGGQALDLAAEKTAPTLEQLERIHRLKTGALIRASILLGTLGAGIDQADALQKLDTIANHIGLAFQIQDDILDITGSSKTMGKHAGADAKKNKSTYPQLCSLAQANHKVDSLYRKASQLLDSLQSPMPHLKYIVTALQNRKT